MIFITDWPKRKAGEHVPHLNSFKLTNYSGSLKVKICIAKYADAGVSRAVDLCAAPGSWSQV